MEKTEDDFSGITTQLKGPIVESLSRHWDNYMKNLTFGEGGGEDPFENWDCIIRDMFLSTLDAAKEIKPNTPEWTFVWNSLHCYKSYAEGKESHINESQ